MQTFRRSLNVVESHLSVSKKISQFKSPVGGGLGLIALEPSASVSVRQTPSNFLQHPTDYTKGFLFPLLPNSISCSSASSQTKFGFQTEFSTSHNNGISSVLLFYRNPGPGLFKWGTVWPPFPTRCITTTGHSKESVSVDGSNSIPDVAPRIKFKRLDKTAKHIMQILDKEEVEDVRAQREILDIKPGYIVQLKVEVPENRRRVSILKGIVIARRNAGLNSTFRIRRLVAGVGVESVFPLDSPNIKEMKVLDKKKVRRAKLYYLRDKMNALKKH